MFLIETYDVLSQPIEQKFDKCAGDATLFVVRADVVAFIAVRMASKKPWYGAIILEKLLLKSTGINRRIRLPKTY